MTTKVNDLSPTTNYYNNRLMSEPTEQVDNTDSQARPEERVAGIEISIGGLPHISSRLTRHRVVELTLENNGHNNSIDGHGFTENNSATEKREQKEGEERDDSNIEGIG
jgi:hypothetical protein